MTGKELLAVRKAWGMTQREFAARTCVTIDQVANWERGRQRVTERVKQHLTDIHARRIAEQELEWFKKVSEWTLTDISN